MKCATFGDLPIGYDEYCSSSHQFETMVNLVQVCWTMPYKLLIKGGRDKQT